MHSRTSRQSPIPSLKLVDFSKQVTMARSSKNLSYDGAKSRRLSIPTSPSPLEHLKQQTARSKVSPILLSEIHTARTIETINLPTNAILSIGNYDNEGHYRSSRTENGISSIILPKLNGYDAKQHILKNTSKKSMPTLSSDLSRAGIHIRRPSIQKNVSKKVRGFQDDRSRDNSIEEKRYTMPEYNEDIDREEIEIEKRFSALKMYANGMKKKVGSLEKENQELRGMVKMYRDMVNKNHLPDLDISLKDKLSSYDLDGSKTARSAASGTTNKGQVSKSADTGLHERLSGIFKVFSRLKSMFYTLDSAATEACRIFDCGFARILITDDLTKKLYSESGSEKYKSESVMVGRTRVDVIEKKEEAIVDMAVLNSIDSIEGLKKLVSTDRKGISCPIFSVNNPEELLGAIQVCEPMVTTKHDRTKRKSGFSVRDTVTIGTFARVISQLIDSHHWDWKMREYDNKITKYNDSLTQMVNTRTQQELLEIFKVKFSEWFNFEHTGLLFYEPKEEHMYTFNIQRKQDGRFYSTDALMYSSKYGVSGRCITQNIDIMSLGEPRKNKHFQSEVDNTTSSSTVRNMIVALLKGDRGQKVGVMQLINKRGRDELDERDELAVRSIQRLLGAIISHVNDVQTTVNLSSAMSKTMKNIEETLNP